jgi:hypothetical protein
VLKRFPRLRRVTLTLAVMLGLIVASTGAVVIATPATPAAASATWCLYTSQVRIGGVTVPTGQYCFSVLGSGTRVDATTGSWNGPVAPWPSERVTFYNRYGTSYASWITYSGSGNTYGYRYWRSGISGYASSGGSVCGEFMASGVVIGKICHRIS